MKKYRNTINLNQNSRGCYIIDTVKGCSYTKAVPNGCYGECYAANIANRYNFNFSEPVKRDFIYDKGQLYFEGFYDLKHESQIIRQINNIEMPFVRIGEMGDPSEFWEHTLNISETLKQSGKKIVIVTKHWKNINSKLLDKLDGITINTSISAMDSKEQIKNRLTQYNRLKSYCNSILRVVTCDFNVNNEHGYNMNKIQNNLLKNDNIIETVFRPSNNNDLVKYDIIKVKMKHFIKGKVLASARNDNIYFGDCRNCLEMCGINLNKEYNGVKSC